VIQFCILIAFMVLAYFAGVLVFHRERKIDGPMFPTRPKKLPVKTFPLAGCDPRVAAVIERGGSDEELIHEAENLAYRLYNGSVPRDQQQRPRDGLARSQGGPVQSLDGLVREVLSIPHVTATTPKVTYDLNEKCADCEFETMTMFGGEVAIPVRTYACPKHQEHP
jgi:hypothetical protein